jgi:glycosyltransferase involved in cell wall biosynthesis
MVTIEAPPAARRLRIAWIGEAGPEGGVPGLCRVFLRELATAGVELDWFSRGSPETVPELSSLATRARVRVLAFPFKWEWDSWYGRNPKIAFVVASFRRVAAFQRLAAQLVQEHRRHPYDAVIQFSQAELFGLRAVAPTLPLIIFPCVHAAGELYWCRKEEVLSRRCEPWWWRKFRLLYLKLRLRLQKRDYHLATGVLGLSERFNDLVAADYQLPREKLGVVYHPVELTKAHADRRTPGGTVKLLYVGRISVRKGIELLVEVIPRLLAADAALEVTIVGEGAQWSNYEALLKALPAERCVWRRGLSNEAVFAEMEQSDILLIPSSYEPGGIVVGEALACGMVVVPSDEVGSAETLSGSVAWSFPAGDGAAFERAIVAAVAAVRANGPALRRAAREAAEAQFEPAGTIRRLLTEVDRLISLRRRMRRAVL